jgi:YD repeat-containing protein
MSSKVVPARTGLTAAQTRDVFYEYDNRGLQTKARFDSPAGEGVTTAYDGFGRVTGSTLAMAGTTRTLSSLYDSGGNRTRLTHPDGAVFGFGYDGLGRMNLVHDDAVIGQVDDYLIRYTYNAQGNRFAAVRGAGLIGFTTATYYDNVQRPSAIINELPGTTNDMSVSLSYNPAGQIRQYGRSNDAYGSITVSIDDTDVALVSGFDRATGDIYVESFELSIAEKIEHEIAGHANDILNGKQGLQGGVDAENAYRIRRGESFVRVGHGGRIIEGH